jgi:CTP:molybdopterin cytidylyltransferase MocA
VIGKLAQSEVRGVTVVLGRNWQEIYPTIQHMDAQIVVNPRPESGMLSSAKWGIAHVSDDADGYLFVLGDQPQILPETVNALIAAAETTQGGIVLPTYSGRRGHPLLVSARLKQAILGLPESGGLNQLLANNPHEVHEVTLESESVLKDIDTPEEYGAAQKD